ncbi:MAG: SpoIIE family protein phosphatase [Candidatus Eremiobacteraeota bacterium]|nr:SpoIIE family protein phosphatase [Candidatus Eremiobacteraeota bacterium]MBV8282468.1 SpoIIE family protein phosphatase [Candidatus Eremiobacteraeota bacterium]
MQNNRLLVVWALVFVVALAALVFGGFAIRKSAVSVIDDEATIRTTRGLLFAVLKDQLDEETAVRGFAVTHQREFLEPYDAARETMPVQVTELEAQLQTLRLTSDVTAVEDAKRVNDEWVSSVALVVIEGKTHDLVGVQVSGKRLVDEFRVDMAAIDHDLSDQYALLGQRSQDEVSNFTGFVLIAGGLLLAAALLFTAFQVAAHQRYERVQRQARDAERREETVHAAYQAERRIAQNLQEAIKQRELPVLPSIALSAIYVPAKEEAMVGGDWYDAFDIGAGRIFFTIGDITGHGIDAAVAMSRVRSSVLSAALRDLDPAGVLARINQEQCEGRDWPLVTAIVGVADSNSYEISYASAGHPPPILLEPGVDPALLELGSLPLGASKSTVYVTHHVRAVPDAMLVLYTDGVVEQTRNVITGERALVHAVGDLTKAERTEAARAIYDRIFGAQAGVDDIAIMTVAFSAPRRSDAARPVARPASAPADPIPPTAQSGIESSRNAAVPSDATQRRRVA